MSNELFSEVVKTISLDFAQKTSPVTVFAKQGDNRTRIIHIQPLMNGVPMKIDRSFQYVSKFAAKKPDGHYVYNDSATINDDGTITVTLTDQTLAAHGNAICCIVLETQSGDVLSSQNFTLIIEFSAGAYQNLASSDEILGLDDKLAQVQAMIDRLEAESKTLPPINPEDKDKVLTANEDGTAGWKEPKGNANFIFADSEEELPDPSTVPENTMAFIPQKKAPVLSVNGETPDENGNVEIEVGGGGTPILVFNSLAEVPADLPEGTIVLVPSDDDDSGYEAFTVEFATAMEVPDYDFGEVLYRYISDKVPTIKQLQNSEIMVNGFESTKHWSKPEIEEQEIGYPSVNALCATYAGDGEVYVYVIPVGNSNYPAGIYIDIYSFEYAMGNVDIDFGSITFPEATS